MRFGKEPRERYGRLLAYVFRAPDGLFVNIVIVRQGYGHAYVKYLFKHMELFRHYESRGAKIRKRIVGFEVKQNRLHCTDGNDAK